MKTFLTLAITSIFISVNAQIITSTPPVIKDRGISSGLKVSSRRSTLIEKEIINLSKFKDINIQKIIMKDVSDNRTETTLGIMMEYETFDRISKKTLTIEKTELSKLIQSLEILEQRENEKVGESTKKYKFTLANNIEIGAVYKENQKKWVNYFTFPVEYYSHSVNEFSKDELKDLIKILKKAEKEL